MTRFLTVCAILLTLAVFGCKPSEEGKTAETHAEKTGQKMEQTAPSAAEETKETAAAVAEKTEEAVSAAVEKTEQMARETTEKARQMVAEATEAVSAAAPPESLVFDASYGIVTFPHGLHAESHDCATCHGDGTPGAFGLDKDKAHELCRGCHKNEGAGPTNCRDCHKK